MSRDETGRFLRRNLVHLLVYFLNQSRYHRLTMALFSNAHREFTISPQCPWYEAQQAYGPPNVNWCEQTVCHIINEPANTWSNLIFLFVGLIIIGGRAMSLGGHLRMARDWDGSHRLVHRQRPEHERYGDKYREEPR